MTQMTLNGIEPKVRGQKICKHCGASNHNRKTTCDVCQSTFHQTVNSKNKEKKKRIRGRVRTAKEAAGLAMIHNLQKINDSNSLLNRFKHKNCLWSIEKIMEMLGDDGMLKKDSNEIIEEDDFDRAVAQVEKTLRKENKKDPQLSIRVWYQRGLVWKKVFQFHLIRTLFGNGCIPEIIVHENNKEGTSWNLCDGIQRILTILGFIKGELYFRKSSELSKITLKSGEEVDLAGIQFHNLSRERQQEILAIKIPVKIIDYSVTKEDIRDYFVVLQNRTALNQQDKHKSDPGQMNRFIHDCFKQDNPNTFWCKIPQSIESRKKLQYMQLVCIYTVNAINGKGLEWYQTAKTEKDFAKRGFNTQEREFAYEILDYLSELFNENDEDKTTVRCAVPTTIEAFKSTLGLLCHAHSQNIRLRSFDIEEVRKLVIKIKNECPDSDAIGKKNGNKFLEKFYTRLLSLDHTVRSKKEYLTPKEKKELYKLQGYQCRLCGLAKDFDDCDGHHIKPNTDPNSKTIVDPSYMAIVCTECHARIHYGEDKESIAWNEEVEQKLKESFYTNE